MAYVQPNSVIQFFRGINLDNRYLHTIYFASESAQNTWFSGKVAKSIQGHSYQRYTVNQIKVKGDATEFLDLSYMRFKNDRGVDMWFYAFITGIDYINENNVVISYEIDVMQTWFIQKGSVRPCMVLREHVNDDTFGRNLEDEPVGSDIYDKTHIADANTLTDINGNTVTNVFENYNLIVLGTGDPKDAEQFHNGVTWSVVDGLFNNILLLSEPLDNSTQAYNNLYDDMYRLLGSWNDGEQTHQVLDMHTFPRAFSPSGMTPITFTKSFNMPTTFDLYEPKNKKLLGYPYNFLLVTSKDGSCGQFKWECFNNVLENNPTFKLQGTALGSGNIICYPMSYNGVSDDIDDKVVMNDFPKNPFSYDAYQAWIASGGKTRLQNAENINNARMFVSASKYIKGLTKDSAYVAGNALSAYSDYQLGKYVSAGVDAIQALGRGTSVAEKSATFSADISEAMNKIDYQWKDAEYRPNIVVGTPSPVTSVGYKYLNFYFIQVHLRENEAKHIDDFFSCYGYAINRVKQPNLTGRQYWNFVQTENCVIAGDMPSSSKDAIARIFDGGITFWHNGDNVGNYGISVTNGSINNPII